MENNTEFKEQILKALDKIKPYLQADGGDITLVDVTEDNVVKLKLLGACGTCPYSIQTLKAGVEMSLKKDFPQIKEVISV